MQLLIFWLLGKNRIERLLTRRSGKEIYIWASPAGRNMKIFVSQMNVLQRASNAEDDLIMRWFISQGFSEKWNLQQYIYIYIKRFIIRHMFI